MVWRIYFLEPSVCWSTPSRIHGQKGSGSRFSDPDPHQRSIFNPKNCFKALGNMILGVLSGSGSRIRILIFYPSRIRIRNTDSQMSSWTPNFEKAKNSDLYLDTFFIFLIHAWEAYIGRQIILVLRSYKCIHFSEFGLHFGFLINLNSEWKRKALSCVADPDPDP